MPATTLFAATVMPPDLHHPAGFLELPEELIIAILSLLEAQDILRARRVCRQLHDISRETYFWLQVLQRRGVPDDILPVVQMTYGARVESLAFKRARRMMGRGEVKRRVVKTAFEVKNCHFIPGARWLITVSCDRSVHAWDSAARNIKPILLRPSQPGDRPDDILANIFSVLDHTGGGNCTLVIGKANCDWSQYQIDICQITICEDKLLLSNIGTILCPKGNGSIFLSGNCIARFLNFAEGPVECFRWDQCLSGQSFGYAALNISLPASRPDPEKLLPGGRLVCHHSDAIMVFEFPEFSMVNQLGKKPPHMAAVPIWWFSPMPLSWLTPTMKWPEPAQLSLSFSSPTFVGSFSLLNDRRYVFRLSIQDDSFEVDQLGFQNYHFVRLGLDLGFAMDGTSITSLQVIDRQVVSGECLELRKHYLPYAYAFDDIFGNVCSVNDSRTHSDSILEFFM